jgi:hypothetical protein
MELVYTNVDQTSIQATLEEGRSLGNAAGPAVIFVPVDEANREYQAILESGEPIAPYQPPPAPEPAPVTLPAAMPTDPDHATPKAYVDAEIAKLVTRIESLRSN